MSVRDVVDVRSRVVRAVSALAAVASLGMATASYRYTVRAGDTLSAIAARAGVSVGALMAANHLGDANRIFAGQSLVLVTPTGAPTAGYPAQLRSHPQRLVLLPSFRHWAAVSGVPANLLEAMTWMESGWQTSVVSSSGAVGIGQLEPATVRFVSTGLIGARLDPHRADDNIRMSAAYLAWLLRQAGGRVDTALADYYQGIGSVARRGVMPETRHYVQVITLLRAQFGRG